MDDLLIQFEKERDAEYRRLTVTVPRVKISRYTPRLTDRRDQDRRNKIMMILKQWVTQWWDERGFDLIPNGDEFAVHERH
jgi:hypothetical protein